MDLEIWCKEWGSGTRRRERKARADQLQPEHTGLTPHWPVVSLPPPPESSVYNSGLNNFLCLTLLFSVY